MKLFELDQPQTTHAVFTFGRLNPPHYGHHAMINTLQKVAKEKNGNWFLFVSSKQEPEKNPLTYEQKVAWIKALFPETVGHLVEDPTIKTPLVAATWLYKQGFRSITFVAGEDDMESYSRMILSGNEHGKKNPQAVEQGKGFIFDPIDFAISPRLASATNARAAVSSGDKEAFARAILGPKITDPKLLNAVEDQLYPTVRKAMNLGESKNLKKKLLDKPTPTVAELAEKYHCSLLMVEMELERGIKVEMEHTNDKSVAREIALDHLNEKLDYYKELAKMEESWSKKYKKSINCNNPKGFSQRAHCAGRKARQSGKKTKSQSVSENFADGKGPGRPGDSRRQGIPKKATIAQLEKHAKRPGRAGQLARWQLNMRRGKKKANEDIVDEASMSAGALADFAKSPLAQSMSVGFEAEMVYPNVSSDRKGEGDKPDFSLDQPLPVRIGWRDSITDFFTEGDRPNSLVTVSRVVDDLRDSYATWCEEGFEYWIKTNEGKELAEKNDISHSDVLAAYKDDSTYLQHIALNRLLRIYAEQKSTIKEYLNERGWTSMKDVWELYKRYLHWPYTSKDEEEASSVISPNGLARSLANSLNVKSVYSREYHGTERDDVTWIFEPDSSIKVSESGEGLELVSPPMPFAIAMKKLDDFFKWAKSNNAYTNKSTGFHVGVSIPNQTMENIDHLKLILFLGDQYVLAQFGRSFNSYAESYYKKLTDFLELGVGGDVAPLLDKLRQGIASLAFNTLKKELVVFQDRYVSVNIKGNYIEFRSAGGDYVNDFDKIKNTILRYVRVMGIAADPEAYKNEYATKTYKLLNAGMRPDENNQSVKLFDMYVAGLITRSELKDKLRLTQAKRQAQKGTIPGEGPDGPGTYLVTYSYVVTANGQQGQHTSTRKASDRKSAVNQVLEILATTDGISNYKIIKADRLIVRNYKVTYKGEYAYIGAQDPADAIAKARTYTYFGTGSSVPDSEFTVEISEDSKNSADTPLSETLKKVKGKWALVSRSNPKKVLQYYKGSGHPSKDWVRKVERRVHSFESAEEKVQPIIYLDMDGVLADFFGEWAKLDGKNHYKDINNTEATLQMVREHPSFWVDLPVLPRARELIKLVLKHYGEYSICTKPLEGDPRCKEGKLQWIKDNLSDIPPKQVVFSYNKEEHALKDGVPCVLVDDYGKNINAWRAAGGIGLKYETDNHDKVAEILVKLARSGVVK